MGGISPVLAAYLGGFESQSKNIGKAHDITQGQQKIALEKERLQELAKEFEKRMEMAQQEHELQQQLYGLHYKDSMARTKQQMRENIAKGLIVPESTNVQIPGMTGMQATAPVSPISSNQYGPQVDPRTLFTNQQFTEVPGIPRQDKLFNPSVTEETPFGPMTVNNYGTPESLGAADLAQFQKRTEYKGNLEHRNRMEETGASNESRMAIAQANIEKALEISRNQNETRTMLGVMAAELSRYKTQEGRAFQMHMKYGSDDPEQVMAQAKDYANKRKWGEITDAQTPLAYKPLVGGVFTATGDSPVEPKVAQGIHGANTTASNLLKMVQDFDKNVPTSSSVKGKAGTFIAGLNPWSDINSMKNQMKSAVNDLAKAMSLTTRAFDSDKEKTAMLALMPTEKDTPQMRQKKMVDLRTRILNGFNGGLSTIQNPRNRIEWWDVIMKNNPLLLDAKGSWDPVKQKILKSGNFNSTYWEN